MAGLADHEGLAPFSGHEHRPLGLTWAAPPAAFTENTEHRFGALHFAYLPVSLVSESPVPLRPAIGVTVSLAGRDSGDYYGHSVTAGLASRPVIPRSSLPYVVSVR